MKRDLTETTLSSTLVYQGDFLTLKRDIATLPDGSTGVREYVMHPGASVVIPLFADGRVLVERQFRYPSKRAFVEFPAGKIDAGESALQTAVRELREETGYAADRWIPITTLNPTIGYSNEVMQMYVATELKQVGQKLDAGEFLDLEIVTVGWMMDEVLAGRLSDTKTQCCLFWLEKLQSGRLPWPAPVDASALR